MSMNLGPYSNFHEMNLDWLIKEWYDTKEALIGDQHQWQEFKENMTKAWEEYKVATNAGIADKESQLDAQYNAFTKAINTKINDNQTAFDDLKKFCEDYFKNLDVSEEIGEKLESMKNDGSLGRLINPTISNEVSAWLNTNITNPLNPPLDKSLSTEHTAAPSYIIGAVANIARTYLDIINQKASSFDSDLSITDCNYALEYGLYTISKSAAKKYDTLMDEVNGKAFLLVKNTPVADTIISSLANHDVFQFLVTQHVDKSYHFRMRYLEIKMTGIEGSEESHWTITSSTNFVELFKLDKTLSVDGGYADAKAVGDKIAAVKKELSDNINNNKSEVDGKLEQCLKYVTSNFSGNINTSGLIKGVYYFEKASVTDDKFPGVEKDKLVCACMEHYENEDINHKIHQSLVCKYEMTGSSFYKTYHRDFESSNLPVEPIPKWVDENPLVTSVDYNDTSASDVKAPSAKAVVDGMRNIADLSLMAKGADTDNGCPGIYDTDGGVNVRITDSNLNEIVTNFYNIPYTNYNVDSENKKTHNNNTLFYIIKNKSLELNTLKNFCILNLHNCTVTLNNNQIFDAGFYTILFIPGYFYVENPNNMQYSTIIVREVNTANINFYTLTKENTILKLTINN